MEDVASDLLRKKDRMLDKYRILMLQESMVSCTFRSKIIQRKIVNIYLPIFFTGVALAKAGLVMGPLPLYVRPQHFWQA